MATVKATKAGNWSDTTVWDGDSHVPIDGDAVDLDGFIVAMDVERIPATSGTLLSLGSPAKAGQLTIALDSATFHTSGAKIFATTITGGTVAGFIKINDTTTTHVCTITGNVLGGSATNARGISLETRGPVIINGNLTGGNGTRAHGLFDNIGSGNVTINGNINGGSGVEAAGLFMTNGSVFTYAATNQLIDSSTAAAVSGSIPPVWTPAATAKITKGGRDFYIEAERNTDPGEANVKTATAYTIYNVGKTGSLSAGGGGIFMPTAKQIGV